MIPMALHSRCSLTEWLEYRGSCDIAVQGVDSSGLGQARDNLRSKSLPNIRTWRPNITIAPSQAFQTQSSGANH